MNFNKIRTRGTALIGAVILAAGGLAYASEPAPEGDAEGYIEFQGDTEFIDAATHLTYYKENNLERYLNLSHTQEQLTAEEIVFYVNTGLDYPFYELTKPIEDPQSILVICNKYNKLDASYKPEGLVSVASGKQLRSEAAAAYKKMAQDMKSEGLSLTVRSAYRSYSVQSNLYDGYVRSDGRENADRYSARPGHSEHQTGLAADVVQYGYSGGSLSGARFERTKQYGWLLENAHLYGFILRYPEGKEEVTGYMYEPWHWRYIGVEHATAMYDYGIETYEEYYTMFIDVAE